jgi:hypothetical protein
MHLVRASAAKRRLGFLSALGVLALAAVLLASAATAPAAVTSCPTFRVLHNDRIGAANLPAGTYNVTPASGSGLTCAAASQFFTRFLEDYDGVLPRPWRVVAEGSGRASFPKGSLPGFSVARIGGGEGEGGNRSLGKLCPNAFTVNAGARVGPLFFAKGQYLLYLPTGSGISCNRAAVLFTRFLSQPGGTLPYPWRLMNQTATFYKPANPTRSSFRVEPLAGT